jgi:hypothetical protein
MAAPRHFDSDAKAQERMERLETRGLTGLLRCAWLRQKRWPVDHNMLWLGRADAMRICRVHVTGARSTAISLSFRELDRSTFASASPRITDVMSTDRFQIPPMKCTACARGDHRFCGFQVWCTCDDPDDGDATQEEFDAYQRARDEEES